MKTIFLPLILFSFFIGCSDKPSKNNTSANPNAVEVFTTAPVLNAVVTDAANQLAVYNPSTKRYEFPAAITYPITVRTNASTFVDVDYDNTKSATDLLPLAKFQASSLKSWCNEVNYLTNLYYSTNYEDANVSTQTYQNDINARFGIDICASPQSSESVAKVVFGAYNYVAADNNLTKIEEIESDVALVDDFFTLNLTQLSIDRVQYYSAYNALVQLDKQYASRADTLHKPEIPGVLRESVIVLDSYENLDVRDLYTDGNYVYAASAQDEFAQLDSALTSRTFYGSGNLDGFGVSLFAQTYNATQCLFLANKNDGILPFTIDANGVVSQHNRIYKYVDSSGNDQNLTDRGITSLSGFVSVSENKRFLGISTEDKGFYLVNAKNIFSNCQLTTDISDSTLLINEGNTTSISAAFRDDGSFVYVAKAADGIDRYDLSVPTQADINNSKASYTLNDSQAAYNIRLFPNSNELLVTTDKGLQVYDITNDNTLSYVSAYPTEGAQKGYINDIDLNGNFILLTDGYMGVKVLKLDSSYTPQLCGVEYFAPTNNPYELAKVTSVAYTSDGYVYVGFDSYGIVRIRFNDLLFRHCQ